MYHSMQSPVKIFNACHAHNKHYKYQFYTEFIFIVNYRNIYSVTKMKERFTEMLPI